MAERIKNVDFGEVKGFINPSYLDSSTTVSEDLQYDCATVGRCDNEKAPFLVHLKLQRSDLNSLVMTNDGVYKSDAVNDYVASNQHWDAPSHTLRGLPHDDVMKNIAKSKVFCSTWPKESWGITAMESLGCGVPTILMTDDSNAHASEAIAADSSHYIKINRKCSDSDFEEAVRSLMDLSYDKRLEISNMTKEKHSLENWKLGIDKMVQMRYNDKNKTYSDLTEFFT
tara:strand:+ start:64 stop:744 length:681 start_codon:yes stop_codon:yes gene_type:complete